MHALLSSVERFLDSALEETGGVVVFGSAFDDSYNNLKILIEANRWRPVEGVNFITAVSSRNSIKISVDHEGKYTCSYKTIQGGKTHTTTFNRDKLGKLEAWLRKQLD